MKEKTHNLEVKVFSCPLQILTTGEGQRMSPKHELKAQPGALCGADGLKTLIIHRNVKEIHGLALRTK